MSPESKRLPLKPSFNSHPTTAVSYQSTSDPSFIGILESWFCSRKELLVLVRFSHSAGARSFEFFSNFQTLISRIGGLPPQTCLTVFKEPQLPLRGTVDESFTASCLELIPDHTEFLLVEMTPRTYGSQSWFHCSSGESHEELRKELLESQGSFVAVGLYPPWLNDTDAVTSAVVPDAQGNVITGVY